VAARPAQPEPPGETQVPGTVVPRVTAA